MDRIGWEEHAVCVYSPNPNAWFEIEDAIDQERVASAELLAWVRTMCEMCPCILVCLSKSKGMYGIWAGKTAKERGMPEYKREEDCRRKVIGGRRS